MHFKEITIERNFHIMNDDRFIMEKISATIQLDDSDDEQLAINTARAQITDNFKIAYPKVYTHLNFDEVVQVTIPKGEPPYFGETYIGEKEPPIDQSFNLIDEINKCKKPLLLTIYEPMAKTPEEKKAYNNKLKELTPTENY